VHYWWLVTLASHGVALAQAADPSAKPTNDEAKTTEEGFEEVTVTGSRICGVIPVGSALINISVEDIQKSGANSISDVLRQVP